MDIPADILAEIEADVERYRAARLAKARKRLTPEYQDKLLKAQERQWIRDHRDEIAARFAAGESPSDIAASFKFVSEAMIKNQIYEWLWRALNRCHEPGFDWEWNYVGVPKYSEWRKTIKELLD
jgi:hypothetical protein